MEPLDIGRAYDQITGRWDDPVFDRENAIEPHRRALAFLITRGRALDVGCGCTGRIIDLLRSTGLQPEGIDVSREMIRLARLRDPDVVFHHADISTWPLTESYDFISAWDSIWHLPLIRQRPVMEKLCGALSPGGVLIFSFGGTDAAGEHVDDTMGPELSYSTLGINGYLALFLELGLRCRHLEFDQPASPHCYCIVQRAQSAANTA